MEPEEATMHASDEVREAVSRFYERLSSGDVEGSADTIDADPEACVIGTQRVGSGRAAWLESLRENAALGVVFEAGPIRAWAEGDMGFALDEPTIVLPDGVRVPTRMTAVLRRSGGVFRHVHQHYSFAVPDEVGLEHASAWRELLGTARA